MGYYAPIVQKFYVAYFNRPADVAGLQYWEDIIGQNGSTDAISAAFASSGEYRDTYAGQTNQQLVNQVYQNLFGRNAESTGLAFWADLLNRKLISIDNVVTQVARGAQGSDLLAFEAKVEAAYIFTEQLRQAAGPVAESYRSTGSAEIAKQFITSISDTASLKRALDPAMLQTTFDRLVNADVPARTLTLSNQPDHFAPDGLQSLAGSDRFIATGQTLNSGDTLDGGGGINQLNLQSTSTTPLALGPGLTISNIQFAQINTLSNISLDTRNWQDLRFVQIEHKGSLSLQADEHTAVLSSTNLGNNGLNRTDQTNIDLLINGGSRVEVVQRGPDLGMIHTGAVTINPGALAQSVVVDNVTSNLYKTRQVLQNSVTIHDQHFGNSSGSIKEISIKGFHDALIEASAVTTLTLAKGEGTLKIDPGSMVNDEQTLSLNLINNASALELGDGYQALNINVADKNDYSSRIPGLSGSKLSNLNISGDSILKLQNLDDLKALTTLTVVGTVSLTADISKLNVKQVYIASNDVDLTLDGSKTTCHLNDGFARLRFNESVISQNYTLGSKGGSVDISNSHGLTGRITGSATAKDGLTANPVLLSQLVSSPGPSLLNNFEYLTLRGSANGQSIDLSRLGNINDVNLAQTSGNLSFTHVAQNTGFELPGNGNSYQISNAAFEDGRDDIISLTLSSRGSSSTHPASQDVTIDNVEVLRINNYNDGLGLNGARSKLTVHDKALEEIQISGSALEISSDSARLLAIRAYYVKGGLSYTALEHGRLMLIEAPQAADTVNMIDLTALTTEVNYVGGNGADLVRISGASTKIDLGTGGADKVSISNGNALHSFPTIKHVHSGVTLALPDPISKISPINIFPNGAGLNTLANVAIRQLGDANHNGDKAVAWFWFVGDTWLVQSRHDGSASNGEFIDGTDVLIHLTGLINLSQTQIDANHQLLFR